MSLPKVLLSETVTPTVGWFDGAVESRIDNATERRSWAVQRTDGRRRGRWMPFQTESTRVRGLEFY